MRTLVILLAFSLFMLYFRNYTDAPVITATFLSTMYATVAGTVLTSQGRVALRRIWRNIRGGQQPG